MRGMLSPSLMCADVLNLEKELTVLDNLGVDYIHLDFMDNKFVPNITLDTGLIKATKSVISHMKRDIHIMAFEPQQYFDRMEIGEGDVVSVHYEACDDLSEIFADIRSRGASPFLAISPDTKPEVLTDFFDEIECGVRRRQFNRDIIDDVLELFACCRKIDYPSTFQSNSCPGSFSFSFGGKAASKASTSASST